MFHVIGCVSPVIIVGKPLPIPAHEALEQPDVPSVPDYPASKTYPEEPILVSGPSCHGMTPKRVWWGWFTGFVGAIAEARLPYQEHI